MTTVSDFLPYFLSAGLNPKSIYKTILSPKEVKNLQNCRYWLTTFRRMRYGVVRVAKQKNYSFSPCVSHGISAIFHSILSDGFNPLHPHNPPSAVPSSTPLLPQFRHRQKKVKGPLRANPDLFRL